MPARTSRNDTRYDERNRSHINEEFDNHDDENRIHSLMQQMHPKIPPQQDTGQNDGSDGWLSSHMDSLKDSMHTLEVDLGDIPEHNLEDEDGSEPSREESAAAVPPMPNFARYQSLGADSCHSTATVQRSNIIAVDKDDMAAINCISSQIGYEMNNSPMYATNQIGQHAPSKLNTVQKFEQNGNIDDDSSIGSLTDFQQGSSKPSLSGHNSLSGQTSFSANSAPFLSGHNPLSWGGKEERLYHSDDSDIGLCLNSESSLNVSDIKLQSPKAIQHTNDGDDAKKSVALNDIDVEKLQALSDDDDDSMDPNNVDDALNVHEMNSIRRLSTSLQSLGELSNNENGAVDNEDDSSLNPKDASAIRRLSSSLRNLEAFSDDENDVTEQQIQQGDNLSTDSKKIAPTRRRSGASTRRPSAEATAKSGSLSAKDKDKLSSKEMSEINRVSSRLNLSQIQDDDDDDDDDAEMAIVRRFSNELSYSQHGVKPTNKDDINKEDMAAIKRVESHLGLSQFCRIDDDNDGEDDDASVTKRDMTNLKRVGSHLNLSQHGLNRRASGKSIQVPASIESEQNNDSNNIETDEVIESHIAGFSSVISEKDSTKESNEQEHDIVVTNDQDDISTLGGDELSSKEGTIDEITGEEIDAIQMVSTSINLRNSLNGDSCKNDGGEEKKDIEGNDSGENCHDSSLSQKELATIKAVSSLLSIPSGGDLESTSNHASRGQLRRSSNGANASWGNLKRSSSSCSRSGTLSSDARFTLTRQNNSFANSRGLMRSASSDFQADWTLKRGSFSQSFKSDKSNEGSVTGSDSRFSLQRPTNAPMSQSGSSRLTRVSSDIVGQRSLFQVRNASSQGLKTNDTFGIAVHDKPPAAQPTPGVSSQLPKSTKPSLGSMPSPHFLPHQGLRNQASVSSTDQRIGLQTPNNSQAGPAIPAQPTLAAGTNRGPNFLKQSSFSQEGKISVGVVGTTGAKLAFQGQNDAHAPLAFSRPAHSAVGTLSERVAPNKSLSLQGLSNSVNAATNHKSLPQSKWEAELRSVQSGFAANALMNDNSLRTANGQVSKIAGSHSSVTPDQSNTTKQKSPEKIESKLACSKETANVLGEKVDSGQLEDLNKSSEKNTDTTDLSVLSTSHSVETSAAPASPNATSKKQSLLQEGESHLALSMIASIYIQLRKMSYLGHAYTSLADLDVNRHDLVKEHDAYGIKKVSVIHRKQNSGYMPSDPSSTWSRDQDLITTPDATRRKKYINNTIKPNSIIRIFMDELDKRVDDDSSLKLFALHEEYDKNITQEFERWIDDCRCEEEEEDFAAERTIHNIRRQIMVTQWRKRMINGYNYDLFNFKEQKDDVRNSIAQRKKLLKETASVKKGDWFRLQRRLVEDHFGIHNGIDSVSFVNNGGMLEPNNTTAAINSRRCSTDALTEDTMNEAFTSTLHNYFKDGSILSKMLKSDSEVVWCGDRHPNDATYCIAVNRRANTVTVIFGGLPQNSNPLYFAMTEQRNPVMEIYKGRSDTVGLHAGICPYLLDKRKDDGTRKIDEISTIVDAVGTELSADGNYYLRVTGHGVGGALSTIFSSFIAFDKRFTSSNSSTHRSIELFTFASPRVGDKRFYDAFRHLEQTGRLRHARFSNTGDFSTITPLYSFNSLRGKSYRHVGLCVKLRDTGILGQISGQRSLNVSHDLEEGWLVFLIRAFKNDFIPNLAMLLGYKKIHNISEYLRRLNSTHIAEQNTVFSLVEYYHMKSNSVCGEQKGSESHQDDNDSSKPKDGDHCVHSFKKVLFIKGLRFVTVIIILLIGQVSFEQSKWEDMFPRMVEIYEDKISSTTFKLTGNTRNINSRGTAKERKVLLDEVLIPLREVKERNEGKQLLASSTSFGLKNRDPAILEPGRGDSGPKPSSPALTRGRTQEVLAFRSVSPWAFEEDIDWSYSAKMQPASTPEFITSVVKSRSSKKAAEQAVKVWTARYFAQTHLGRDIAHEETKKALIALIN